MRRFQIQRCLADEIKNNYAIFCPVSVKFFFIRFVENTAAKIFLQRIKNKRTDIFINLNINRVLGDLMIQEFIKQYAFKTT